MKDSLFGFKDSIEREEFIIVVPVLLFFAWLGYYLLDGSSPVSYTHLTLPTILLV